jgi:hypothetical protein
LSRELPSLEEWEGWLVHPATQALRLWARRQREEFKENWAVGGDSFPTIEAAALRNADRIGRCEVFLEVGKLSYETIIGVLENEHSDIYASDKPSDPEYFGPGADGMGSLG